MEIVSTSSGIHSFKLAAQPAQNNITATASKSSDEKVIQVNSNASPKVIDTDRKIVGTLLDIIA